MNKKSFIAAFLALSMAFGTVALSGCNVIKPEENGGGTTQQGSTQTPGTQTPGEENPGTQNPGTQTPGGEDPGTQNPGTQTPGGEEPGTQDPGTQTPGGEDPGTQNPPVTEIKVTSVTVSPASYNLTPGETRTPSVTVAPTDASNKIVTWSSSNTSVATVNALSGKISAQAAGTATIYATAADGSGVRGTCSVTVSPATVAVESVTLDATSKTVYVNDTFDLRATVMPADATNKTVSWSSSSTAVASVSNGRVTAKAKGTAVITATAGGKSATCTVTVQEKPVVVTTYTVTFYSDDKVVDTKTVESGKLVSAPTSLTKTGYYISGWAQGSLAGANYNFSTAVTGDIELYAKWEQVTSGLTYSYAGNECAAFEWNDGNPSAAKVEYKLSSASSYTTVDSALVRAASKAGSARVDIVGLKKNTNYDFKITDSTGKALKVSNMTINAYDRSGYAHFKNTSGVGAYNDDGTLKTGAKVYYVTEETKNNIDGKGNSIAEFLSSLSKSSPVTVLRVVGKVKCPQYLSENNLDKSITDINGIIRKEQTADSYWNMIDITEAKNVTLEGIGEDATIFQFGFTWKKCQSVEVRNLTFTDYPEDACSFEGSTSSPASYKYFWLHHSVFNIGKNGWDRTDEQDKGEGDGASDLKGVSNVTFSYLQYNNCHKTGLVGGGDTHKTCNVTFHHNYYNGNNQRLPLGRQANMHMYNNYYNKSTMYSISLRANAYALIEYNYFDNSIGKITVEVRNSDSVKNYGCGKLWNNEFVGKKGFSQPEGGSYIVEVSSRTQAVANTNTFNPSFDTDSSYFYYDETSQSSDVTDLITDLSQIPDLIPKLAGVMKHSGTAGSGGSGEGGGDSGEIVDPPAPEVTVPTYEELKQNADVVFKSEFTGMTGNLAAYGGSFGGTAGVYSNWEAGKGSGSAATHYALYEGDMVKQVSPKDGITGTMLDFGDLTGKTVVEGYFDVTLYDGNTVISANSMTFAQFIGTDSVKTNNEVIGLRAESDLLKYRIDGASALTAPVNSVAMEAKTYTVYFKYDSANRTFTVYIDGTLFIENTNTDITSLVGIKFMSGNGNTKTVAVDNVVVCAS